jgi:hypothetical protein
MSVAFPKARAEAVNGNVADEEFELPKEITE